MDSSKNVYQLSAYTATVCGYKFILGVLKCFKYS
jgi:hypothetical protein